MNIIKTLYRSCSRDVYKRQVLTHPEVHWAEKDFDNGNSSWVAASA